jgi:PAS domain S-box-containing protein
MLGSGQMELSAEGRTVDRLDVILEDDEFVLGRSVDAAFPSRSTLVVIPRQEHPQPRVVRMLEHEHSLREQLNPMWAVRPLALTTREGRPALLLEDPGGEPLASQVGVALDVGFVLRVGAGLAAALRQLHGRGLIHKDLKPANVMIDGATGRVWLRGFGISSPFPRERRPPEPPEFIAGTLAYMAPEQTGWMNRSIDARSDLYACGVVLYEMLTGTLPFAASDPMAWVHCHIAKRPVPPAARRADLPGVLSAIVMKLLAKTIEDRYQTAAGVEHDLRRCLTQWEAEGRIDDFSLAEHDTPDRLLIPEQLYGRAKEIRSLLDSFDRVVSSGTFELVLVSGYAGVGKSSVVNELYKSLIPPRGLFASGKFDQYRRDIPYATLAQAFASLIRRLLGKSEADLAPWRDALREALGLNGRLIADLVPELTLIIGDQPAVPDLPPQDARRRFQLVLRKFISVFARADHPLALFLDDLQWLDAATLDLLEDLLVQGDVRHLLLVGAYRDNEVTATHPLRRRLDVIRKAGVRVSEIALAPLTDTDVEQLAADTLRREPAGTAALAHLVHAKTGGNPFSVIQFMSSLAEEGLLVFEHGAASWEWDLGRIEAKGHTDNVVDLLVARLTRLPSETQKALQRLACLGERAETQKLAIVLAISEEQVHESLSPAVRQELVERLADGYRFVHDRVQESAYTLIRPSQRAKEHVRIGRLLASHTRPETLPEHVFELAGQFNRGVALIESVEEREQVAEINLLAGQRAKASGAHASALAYLATGSSLLSADAWKRRYALAFALELHCSECEFLVGDVVAAEKRLMALSARAANLTDLAAITCLREELSTAIGRSDSAVEACLEFLRSTGAHWSPHPTAEVVDEEYESLWRHLGSRSIEAFVDVPSMTDADCRAAMDVLNAALPAALFSDANLFSLVCCRMVNLTLVHGHCDASSVAYVYLGWVLGPRFGKYQAGFEFGKLGLHLVEQRGLRRFEARVYQIFGHLVIPWTQPIDVGRALVERSFEAANQSGDITYATYSCPEIVHHSLAEGRRLADVQREAETGLDFARRVQFGLVVDIMTAQRQLIRTLRGLTSPFGSFNDADFDERVFEQHLADNAELSTAACQYWIYKLKARFFAGDYVAALGAASNAQRFLWTQPTFFQPADYRLYAALTLAALCEAASPGERTEHQNALGAHHRQFQEWAENCPANLEDAATLVGAEVARVEGRDTDAMRLYQRAIAAARARGFAHNEALAYELAGRFYASRGFEDIARLYLGNARRGYLRWGADGKVRQLDALHPNLRNEQLPASDSRGTIGAPVEQLELTTVLKVSQAVSREIALDKLVETILQTAIEQAGAERGVLIEPRGDHLWILAEARTNERAITIVPRDVAVSDAELPESVVRYVARAQESVSLENASATAAFANDAYVRRERARSVLCVPLLRQGQLMALLYLENNLAAGVFTPARMAVLNVLASQAAMSLEKTRLYRELQQREAKIRRLVDANVTGIFTFDLDGRITDANDAFLRIVGYDREDLGSGRLRWTDLTPPEWREQDERLLPQLETSGSLQPFEKEYFRKDGSRVPVLIGVARFDDDTSAGVSLVLDLTELKRAEDGRMRAETQLQQARSALAHRQRVSMMGEVAASLAHEIKQPIIAARIDAKVCLGALAEERLDLQAARDAASRLVKDAAWAAEVITRTTALFKKETERERVNVGLIVHELAVLLQQEASESSIEIRTSLSPGIPDIMADRIQLQQALMNLMLNAIDAMKDSGGEMTITAEPSSDSQLLITVSDTGIGLPAENPDDIFESFVTTKAHGTGMGLAITRSIVESHGGRLWAAANTGRGATLHFTLPHNTVE